MGSNSNITRIIRESVWNSKLLGEELVRNNKRNFFNENNIQEICYEIMLVNFLNVIKDSELGFLLREVWKINEEKLRVADYSVNNGESCYEEGVGVYINISNVSDEDRDQWGPDKPNSINGNYTDYANIDYHTIFHELFHNIDYVAESKEGIFFTNYCITNIMVNTINSEK